MNAYTFEQIEVGMKESFSVIVTEEMMRAFLLVSGDVNPLHNNEDYARGLGYPGRVVYGMLTASLMSTLAGVHMPGKYSLIHRVEADFPKPVLIGDTLCVTGEVRDRNEAFNTIELKVTITNADGKKVCRGKMRIGVTS